MPLSVPVEKLLAWNDATATHWRDFLLANPPILTLPSDIRNSATVADTLQHIVAVELRYAQRLAALPESPYEDIPKDSADALFATHTRAFALIHERLADPAFDWSTELTFDTITLGRLRASRETILLHLTLHSIRHYAQLATLVRQHSFTPTWPMDYLFAAAHRA
ncbi:MAG TPA: DinB family protein [Acidobacteriaceae bacterium]|jgi:uncharacterized damage-inducible protein DinB|nr:DinB family protein [Acidobacteriaceae bacterium]